MGSETKKLICPCQYKGWFATEAALNAAYPTGQEGWYAIVGTTDTVWVWDVGTSAWVDSALGSLVTSVFGRIGVVVQTTNDYTWAQINKSTSDLADITTKSHASLTAIGTNTHAQIDSHIANANIHINWTNAIVAFATSNSVTCNSIINTGDPDNKITFTTDEQTYTLGNIQFLHMKNTTQNIIEMGVTSGDVDFQMIDNAGYGVFRTQGSDGQVMAGKSSRTFAFPGSSKPTLIVLGPTGGNSMLITDMNPGSSYPEGSPYFAMRCWTGIGAAGARDMNFKVDAVSGSNYWFEISDSDGNPRFKSYNDGHFGYIQGSGIEGNFFPHIEATLADDGSFDLPDAVAGIGFAIFDENADTSIFSFTDAGVVTLITSTANVDNADTDGKYCIFQNGTTVRVRNRIGSVKNVKVFMWYQ